MTSLDTNTDVLAVDQQADGAAESAKQGVARHTAKRARITAVTSGKGGVGKTFLSANLAAALSARGERVLVLDADLGLANLDVVLNLTPKITLHDVFTGKAELDDAAIAHIANTVAAWRGIDRHSREGGNPDPAEVRGDPVEPNPEYQDIPGFCRSVSLAEIAVHGYLLTPGRYVGTKEVEDNDEDFATKMTKLTEKLGEQMAKGAELDQLIRQKLGGLGYEF